MAKRRPLNEPPLGPMRRPWHVARHMIGDGFALLPLAVGALFLGMAIYHWVEQLSWADAFLNAAMLLGGMGPISPIKTPLGKWLVGLYALFAGLFFIVLAGVMLAPVLHHVLQRFHMNDRN